MASSKDPGTLGIYGFRNRADHSYEKLSIATSLSVKERRLWEYLDAAGKRSIVIGVPGTFPIVRPVNGAMISCFLTPDINSDYTWPRELKGEIAQVVGEYMIDVKGFHPETPEEGMAGVSPRFVINAISNAIIRSDKRSLTSMEMLIALKDAIESDARMDAKQKKAWVDFLVLARKAATCSG